MEQKREVRWSESISRLEAQRSCRWKADRELCGPGGPKTVEELSSNKDLHPEVEYNREPAASRIGVEFGRKELRLLQVSLSWDGDFPRPFDRSFGHKEKPSFTP